MIPPIPPLILAAAAAIGVPSGYLFWSRRAARSSRTIGEPAGSPAVVYSGGVLSRAVTTSNSMARLELHDWGVRVRGKAPVRWMMPVWEARYRDLTAQLMTGAMSRDGVWLRAGDPPDAIVFWTTHGSEILARLQERGVRTDHTRAWLRRLDDVYRAP